MEQIIKAIINNHTEVDVSSEEELAITEIGKNKYHLLHNAQSHSIEVLDLDRNNKTITFKMDNETYAVKYMDVVDVKVDQMGLTDLAASDVEDTIAPMPGLVLDVHVEAGMEIDKGQPLLILEAMKMENVIKSAHAGHISNVFVQKGDKVEKNQILISYQG